MPPHTTLPPFFTALSAAGTNSPAGANMIAASKSSGGAWCESPAQKAPSERANSCAARSPARVNAYTLRPCQLHTWAITWAAAPNPYKPIVLVSPAATSDRQPIRPAHSSGAAAIGSANAFIGIAKAASATTWLAKPPSRSYPVNVGASQRFSRFARQYSQCPQVLPNQGRPTRCPISQVPEPGPRASTIPTISCPGTLG